MNQFVSNGIKDKVILLDEDDIQDIKIHYDLAMESEHGSGDHWLLISCLSGHGFRANGTDEAVKIAEEITTLWNQLSR